MESTNQKENSEKPEIKYDEVDIDSAIDDFGDETVQFCIQAFLDKTYNELKENIPTLYKAQNYKDIRGKMHILKTNSGYMGATNFQGLCKEFEACCKFETLNVKRVDELYPIFMVNLDKLYVKLKKLYTEKFETEIKEEVELENKNENEKEKENNQNKNDEKDEKEEQNNDNIIYTEEKKEKEDKEEANKEENKIDQENENNNKVIPDETKVKTPMNVEEDAFEENENNIILNKNPVKRGLSLQEQIKKNMLFNISHQNLKAQNNENEKSNISSENSAIINDITKPKYLSSKNVLDLIGLKEGKSQKYHQNQFYKNIFQSFRLTEEESKNKKAPKVRFSPKYTSESHKNKILNILKLGFSSMDKNDIRDSLKRYDLSVLKNSATLVKENLTKFLNEDIPKIKIDFDFYFKNYDLAKKKEVIERINIIISNMKYLSDNYNTFFFRMIERIEICKDRKNFKFILGNLIERLKKLEQELTIIYRVKIQRDNSILKSMGFYQNDNINKNSKKNLQNDYMMNTYNTFKNKENNPEQIEGLKKNLGIYNNNAIKNKNSRKKLKHFPYSFKISKLFSLENKKNIHNNYNKHDSDLKLDDIENNKQNIISDFNNDYPKFIKSFNDAIDNKNKDELIEIINDFKINLVNKYQFINMDKSIDTWISKINKAENFEDLNANPEDITEIINYMKMEIENKNVEIIDHEYESHEDDEENENDDIVHYKEKDKKIHEDIFLDDDIALFSQMKKFNPDVFFLPKNAGFSQHKFKIRVEKMIRETTQKSQEIIRNNYNNSNYDFVEKTSSHIILSQNFRTKKNKLIGYSYPFKEDTFLNNCTIF